MRAWGERYDLPASRGRSGASRKQQDFSYSPNLLPAIFQLHQNSDIPHELLPGTDMECTKGSKKGRFWCNVNPKLHQFYRIPPRLVQMMKDNYTKTKEFPDNCCSDKSQENKQKTNMGKCCRVRDIALKTATNKELDLNNGQENGNAVIRAAGK